MRICFFTIVLALISAVSCQGTLPSFSWEQQHEPIPHLRITYPNGVTDYAILKYANLIPVGRDEREEDVDKCLYDGYLLNEKDVYVTLTGCVNSDTFQIQFKSKHLDNFMFKVTEGKVTSVAPIFGQKVMDRDGSIQTFTDGAVQVPQEAEPQTAEPQHAEPQHSEPSHERGINPRGYVLKVKVNYDDAFYSRFGPDSVNAARRVMLNAQYYWKMRESLGTVVSLAIYNSVDNIGGRHAAKTDLQAVAQNSLDPNFDTNVYLTFRNNQAGTLGMGYVGTVCNPDTRLRSCICEYVQDDMTSGHVVAHEIGHNMGMNHDFGDKKQPRFDSYGQPCSNIGAVMDYDQPVIDKWSPCSVEDFNRYINSVYPQFCLRVLQ